MAALIIDRNERVKMSFRSRGAVPVHDFARQWFEGGGHYNAAGGQSPDTLERTEARFLEALPAFVFSWGEQGPTKQL
jgi:phosphoesterase RecJ-like protein